MPLIVKENQKMHRKLSPFLMMIYLHLLPEGGKIQKLTALYVIRPMIRVKSKPMQLIAGRKSMYRNIVIFIYLHIQ